MSRHNRERRFGKKPSERQQDRPTGEGKVFEIDTSRTITSPLLDVPEEERARIARAVHRAVDTLEGSRTFGFCAYHALAGHHILTNLMGLTCYLQVGSFWMVPDPGDPGLTFYIDAERPTSLVEGEFHVWLADTCGVEIDFSARHWPDMVAAGQGTYPEPMYYRRPHLDFLWVPCNRRPEGIRYRMNPVASRILHEGMREWEDIDNFLSRVTMLYKNPDVTLITLGGIV